MQAGTVGLQPGPILEFSAPRENETVIFGDESRSVSRILADRIAVLDETQSVQRVATALPVADNGASTALREFRDILVTTFSISLPEAA
jgi:hypothetical protein